MIRTQRKGLFAASSALALLAAAAAPTQVSADAATNTATPIKHLVVIFQENVSFDHYFATYPKAANPDGEPAFTAAADTPKDDRHAGPGRPAGQQSRTRPTPRTAPTPPRLSASTAPGRDQPTEPRLHRRTGRL